MQCLFIMQGVPGSGKTTLANYLTGCISSHRDVVVYATDDFHYDNGVYKFKVERLAEFHAANHRRTVEALDRGWTVFVDNTNLRAWEAAPYVRAAVARKVPVFFLRCDGHFDSVHGVPAERIAAMRAAMEELSLEKCLAAKSPFELQEAAAGKEGQS